MLSFLLANPALKERFFTHIDSALIFQKERFLDFLKLHILDCSYTKFANKIGLSFNSDLLKNSLLKGDSHICLNFPYKDCVLKGAQDKDSDKSNEIFFNEILASDEIDILFKPKALCNFELVNSACSDFLGSASDASLQRTASASHSLTSHNPKNSSTILEFRESQSRVSQNKRDSSPTAQNDKDLDSSFSMQSHNTHNLKSTLQNKPNLLIKGNNLLALHTLKSRKDIYGQVKLIYIDPPYNTGSDSFNYNDRFNHSAWLVFMKNRLEIAREFLREDGVIFIQCDDNEQAYLKVLCDEIFGRENFVGCITWHRKRGKDNSAKFLSRVSEYILVFARQISNLTFNRTNLDDSTLEQYTNPDNDPRGNYRKLALWRRRGQGGSKEYSYTTKEGVTLKPRAWLCSENTMQELDNENKLVVIGNNLYRKLFLSEHDGSIPETIWINLSNTANAKDEIKALFLENKNLKTNEESNLFSTPKPEALLKRIIEISTNKGDLVMDFFAGSGTTLAVAHKMGRRWIGIEQMEYVEGITKERLIKVINGEQGGISKAVGWNPLSPSAREGELPQNESLLDCHTERSEVSQDSRDFSHSTNAQNDKNGDISAFSKSQNDKNVKSLELPKNAFIYCELMPLNALYKEKIAKSSNESELTQIYNELQEKAFIDYRVDIKEILKDRDFEALDLESKKQILCAILDSNMDYVAYSDIQDSSYGVDRETIELNKAFYKGVENE